MASAKVKTAFVAGLVIWQLVLTSLLVLAGIENPKLGVLAKMLWGVNLLWIGCFGALSLWTRHRVSAFGKSQRTHLVGIFVGLATCLALIEEAITTAMTNCAPLFGAQIGEVYLTASANYLDVVLMHSIVVIWPQFLMLGWLFHRYRLSPFVAFVGYGLTGFINEALFSGPNPLMLPQWILIYGLMVFLPAHLFVEVEGRRDLRWYGYPAIVLLPVLASIPMVGLLLLVIAPGHPSIHFPPM